MKEHFKNDNQRNAAGEDRALSGLSSFDAQLGPSHMGYIPSLDGLRALAVLAVILYHAHFSWIRGGFIGVEVFFVVSGFLITSLLLEESEDTGGISLRQFWIRRARRLLPALFTMLVVVSAWALLFSKYKVGQLRHDFLAAVFYISNWWQIFSSDVPYFAPSDPPLLRHLWSLAVEEQWYLLWPIAFIALFKWGKNRAKVAQALLVIAASIMVFTAIAYSSSNSDRINFLYLSTITRSTGLLLGAAGAIESIATILAVHHRLAPPTLNLEDLDDEVSLDVVTGEPRRLPDGAIAALNNSFGFGGHNVVLAVRSA